MPPLETEAPGEFAQESLVEIGRFATQRETNEHGLVVLALGWPYWVDPADSAYRLLVEPQAVSTVQHHLNAYARERRRWPPAAIADPWRGSGFAWFTPLLWSTIVLGSFVKQASWVQQGMLDARAVVVNGEWWRAATALFLHADAAHVVSNAFSGLLVFSAVVATMGRLRGWTLVTLSAVTANLAMAFAHYPSDYRSLGASTALFAGVGLLTGRAIRVVARSLHPHRWRAMFVPLAAGTTVLALHGAGGVNVDIGAHLAGFTFGLAAGFLFGLPRIAKRGRTKVQPVTP